jgi:hypothetical protein
MPDVTLPFTGGCACGAIRYTCSAAPVAMINCHCRDCQRSTGGAFASAALVRADTLTLTGEPRMHALTAASGNEISRAFCGTCGSPVFSKLARNLIGVKAGSLDDATWFRPTIDVWTRSAQPWAVMDEGIAKVETQPTQR